VRCGSLKALFESQALHKANEPLEATHGPRKTAAVNDVGLSSCICGEAPTRYIVNVQDGPATLPTPNFECKHCKIDSSRESCDYPEEWKKAIRSWNVYINRIKSRIK